MVLIISKCKNCIAAPCGSNLIATDEAQILSSPNYPMEHDPNLWCRWNIDTLMSSKNFLIEVKLLYITNEDCCINLQVISKTGQL